MGEAKILLFALKKIVVLHFSSCCLLLSEKS